MNIYAGNLPKEMTEPELQAVFEAFGKVMKASIIKDKFTNESRGFGFVTMLKVEEGNAAIAALNGKEMNGQALTVNEAKPRPKPSFGGGGGGYGGGGGHRSGGGGGYGGGRDRRGGGGGGGRDRRSGGGHGGGGGHRSSGGGGGGRW